MTVDYTQFKGKPFQVVSKLGVRYTGIFDHINQEDQTICLSQVYNHGTEDRPSARKLPGSASTLGWVRFHTESIASLALVENYLPPGVEEPSDPILASVSNTAPGADSQAAPTPAPAQSAPSTTAPSTSSAPSGPPGLASLPAKPITSPPLTTNSSAHTALDRVQQSLSDLSVNDNNHAQGQGQGRNHGGFRQFRPPRPAQPIEVPDAEFDFSKGTQALEAEREQRKADHIPGSNTGAEGEGEDGDGESDEEEEPSGAKPHPLAVHRKSSAGQEDGAGKPPMKAAYNKNSFFDQLSGESSRVLRSEERGRNLDTFGEAGGAEYGANRGGFGSGRGGGGGYRGRGGYGEDGGMGQGQGYGGRGGSGGYGGRGGGFSQGDGRGGYSRGGGNGGRGGYGYGQNQNQHQNQGYQGYQPQQNYQQQSGQGQSQGYRGRGGGFPGQNGGGYRGRREYEM